MGKSLLILHDALDGTEAGRRTLMGRLCAELKLTTQTVESMFSDLPVILKSGLDNKQAELYKKSFEELGAFVEVLEQEPTAHLSSADSDSPFISPTESGELNPAELRDMSADLSAHLSVPPTSPNSEGIARVTEIEFSLSPSTGPTIPEPRASKTLPDSIVPDFSNLSLDESPSFSASSAPDPNISAASLSTGTRGDYELSALDSSLEELSQMLDDSISGDDKGLLEEDVHEEQNDFAQALADITVSDSADEQKLPNLESYFDKLSSLPEAPAITRGPEAPKTKTSSSADSPLDSVSTVTSDNDHKTELPPMKRPLSEAFQKSRPSESQLPSPAKVPETVELTAPIKVPPRFSPHIVALVIFFFAIAMLSLFLPQSNKTGEVISISKKDLEKLIVEQQKILNASKSSKPVPSEKVDFYSGKLSSDNLSGTIRVGLGEGSAIRSISFDLATAKPPVLKSEEIVAGVKERVWIKRVLADRLIITGQSKGQKEGLAASESGAVKAAGVAKLYLEDSIGGERIMLKSLIEGEFDSKNISLKGRISVSSASEAEPETEEIIASERIKGRAFKVRLNGAFSAQLAKEQTSPAAVSSDSKGNDQQLQSPATQSSETKSEPVT